jgi:hypothetical protein
MFMDGIVYQLAADGALRPRGPDRGAYFAADALGKAMFGEGRSGLLDPWTGRMGWQGKKDSNLRMPESKSGALGQLGDSPT